MNVIFLFFLLPMLFIAPNVSFAGAETNALATSSIVDIKDLEIQKLKLEIEKLKIEFNNLRTSINENEPSSIRSSEMAEQEFIEIHRTYQNKFVTGVNDYPRSLVLKYKKLMDDYPEERSYSYLYARILRGSEEAVALTNKIIEKWPDFSYGYRLRRFQLSENDIPDCKASLKISEMELNLDSKSVEKEYIVSLTNCIEAEKNESKVFLTYDKKSLNSNYIGSIFTISDQKNNSFTITVQENNTKKSTTIELKYVGMTQSQNDGISFNYEIVEKGDYCRLEFLLMPKNGKNIANYYRSWSGDDFKAGRGVTRLYLNSEDMLNLQEIQLTGIYY